MQSVNAEYRQMLAQARRCIGELEALKAMHYEPMEDKGGQLYANISVIVDDIIEEIKNTFC